MLLKIIFREKIAKNGTYCHKKHFVKSDIMNFILPEGDEPGLYPGGQGLGYQ